MTLTKRKKMTMDDFELERLIERRILGDEIRAARGEELSPWGQAAIRASAIGDAREFLALTGVEREQSLRAERMWIEASICEHRPVVAERVARRDGHAGVLQLVSNAPDERFMSGYAAPFGEWSQIASATEGLFLESIASSAFDRAFAPGARKPVVLFNHGQDPHVGNKPLGDVSLSRDRRGLRYSVELLDANYVDELRPAIAKGLLGSSFRFAVQRDSWSRPTKPTERNPKMIAERTLRDVELFELGPVTFPAHSQAGPVGFGRSADEPADDEEAKREQLKRRQQVRKLLALQITEEANKRKRPA